MRRKFYQRAVILFLIILSSGCRYDKDITGMADINSGNDVRHGFDAKVLDKILNPDKYQGHLLQGQFLASDELRYVLSLPKIKKYPTARQALEEEYGWHEAALSHSQQSDVSFQGELIPTAPTCMQCHAGKIDGKLVIGRANTQIDLGGLLKDLSPNLSRRLQGDYRQVKMYQRVFDSLDPTVLLARLGMLVSFEGYFRNPANHNLTKGSTNAFAHSLALLKWRDNDMGYYVGDWRQLGRPELEGDVHTSYLDAPAWWNIKYKDRLYQEARIKKSPRVIMQFVLSPDNTQADVKSLEPLFNEFLAAIEKTDPPAYPRAIDGEKVAAGEKVFNDNCASCHGVHSQNGTYFRSASEFRWPQYVMPVEQIGTDAERSKTLQESFFTLMEKSWLTYSGKDDAVRHKGTLNGYVANPLWGIWASSPYLHNGSVPTLRALMDPEQTRPIAWRAVDRQGTVDYDSLGLKVEEMELDDARNDRSVYDTTRVGQSNKGHEKEFQIFTSDRQGLENLMEYLKTL